MKKPYLLIFLIFTCFLHSKTRNNLFDPNYLHKLYNEMFTDVFKVPMDTTLIRAEKILDILEEKQMHTSKRYAVVDEIRGETLLLLMNIYDIQKEYDSVSYYYSKIENKIDDKEVLGIAELYISEKKMFENKYFDAIRSLYKALGYFKKVNAVEKEVIAYLKLSGMYKKAKNKDLSREMDSILINHYLKTPIPILLKSQIQINHASYIASLGKNKQAINLLKKINVNDLSKTPYVLKHYYKELKNRYTKLDKIDSASIYLKKMYEIPNTSELDDAVMQDISLGMFAVKEKRYKEALGYVDLVHKNPALKYVEQFELIKLYKIEYLANKMLGKYKQALEASTMYHSVRNSIKNFNLNLNASILNFKLNNNKKIKDLEAKSEMNSLVMEEKKRFYIFSTLLISVSVSILIFLIVQHKRRKKSLKLLYENEKMKEISEMKNNFIENLSHEIRTPITITTGYLQMIANSVMDYSKIVKYADLTIRNNEQIIGMLNNFLTLLKLDKNPIESKKTSDKMEMFLRKKIQDFQGVAEIKGVYIYYKSNLKSNRKIDYHYDDLRKIINNIVSNALKYTNPKHGIYVDTYIDEQYLNIIVKDEGIGIEKKEQKLIFDRFYQTKNNLVNGGFGIGLSLVNELITKLKGTIQLESEKNVGSIFTVQLPLALENPHLYIDEKSNTYKSISKPEMVVDSNHDNLPKILIVDDNIEMIGYLKELLSPTLNCTFAFDGAQALVFAKKKQYDIILTDLRMPLIDGHELKIALNKFENYQAVPFMIMTASVEEYLENKKEEFGINDYLIKPFEAIELITRINHHIEKNIYKKQLQNSEKEMIVYNGAYSEFMEKINKIILENITNSKFSINDLAASCGYSHKQFIQIVQERAGLTPVKMILEIRLRKAYDLIVNHNYENISEVLYAVGLNSRSYFNKVFVKRFGLKPGDLIKKLKIEKKAS